MSIWEPIEHWPHLFVHYDPRYPSDRARIVADAKNDAARAVSTDYPHAVYRDQQGAMQAAEYAFSVFVNEFPDNDRNQEEFKEQLPEMRRLYTSSFVGEYSEEIAKKDKEKEEREKKAKEERERKEKEEKERKERAVQPATPTGATITVIREDHNTPNVHKYWVRIADPIHFGEAQDFPLPLVVDFSEAPATD